MKSRISGKDATYVARESDKRRPIRLMAPEGGEEPLGALVPSEGSEQAREAPPRVLKPSALNDQCLAPTPDLESHRKRLREAFGNTMSDEFVEVLLGKLVEALRPAALESLEEPTVNAALAIIDSMCPQSELEALLAVHISLLIRSLSVGAKADVLGRSYACLCGSPTARAPCSAAARGEAGSAITGR